MWTRSFPATRKVAEILRSKALGEVVLCQGDLGFDIPPSVSRCYDLNQVGSNRQTRLRIEKESVTCESINRSPLSVSVSVSVCLVY